MSLVRQRNTGFCTYLADIRNRVLSSKYKSGLRAPFCRLTSVARYPLLLVLETTQCMDYSCTATSSKDLSF